VRVDLHQHVWTQPLIEALALRDEAPLVRFQSCGAVLHSAGEQPYVIDVAAEQPAARAALVTADQLDLAVVSISSPIGIEALPRQQAQALIDAHLEGVLALGPRFAAWGPIPIDQALPADVDEVLERGCVGISLPAGALAGPSRLQELGPVLERIASWNVPLFVHPGRAPGQPAPAAEFGEPLWWRAMTDYVAQMQAAWCTFVSVGRRWHPELKVVFSMLAGGAPLQGERLASRGGPPVDLRDPDVYYDVSSYGPAAIETIARVVGERQLVYGSDRPVVEPTQIGRERLLQENGAQLVAGRTAVSLAVAA
jgi:predicted TIM-barrel fold metal-dependent hydrolase